MRDLCLSMIMVGLWVNPTLGCSPLQEASAAWERKDVAALEALRPAMTADPACDGRMMQQLNRSIAALLTAEGDASNRRSEHISAENRYRKALAADPQYWPAHDRLGQLAEAGGDWNTALQHYEHALLGLELMGPDALARHARDLANIEIRARDARMQANGYVAPPPGRDGTPSGLWSERLRFAPEPMPVPIRFAFDSFEIVGTDLSHAQDLLAFLIKAEAPQRIILIGHTDERGDAAYNRTLSRKRAEAVQSFLQAKGFAGQIEIEFRGEESPYTPRKPRTEYSNEELWRFDRRVEFRIEKLG